MSVEYEPYIFISYSTDGREYVGRLVDHLDLQGIASWIDRSIEPGERWLDDIRDHVDNCAAFVVVMTPDAAESKLVRREVGRAQTHHKEILPLLLKGRGFPAIAHIEHEDVSDGRMPSPRAIKRLQRFTSTADSAVPVDARVIVRDWIDEGSRLAGLGRWDEVLDAAHWAVGVDRSLATVHNIRGTALHELGSLEEAVAAYDRAIELNPGDALFHYNRGVSLSELQRFTDAVAAYDEAIKRNPGLAEAHGNRGDALWVLRRFEEAVEALDQAIEIDPDDARLHFNRGNLLSDLDRFEEAVVAYDRAVKLDPELASAHCGRGIALSHLGRLDEAIASYDRAIELDPDLAVAHEGRAATLGHVGQSDG